ncbi:hypothetical protein AB0D46_30140 [Streptomyces sp. NPDC048383]|uniref:hypothetical protein n=1 Tax=Streptomyces sp. NPDC048383 TaxID=3155386 RepID=UPI003418A368
MSRRPNASRPGRPSPRATPDRANLLGISLGALITEVERACFDSEGRSVETADLVVPDSRYEIAYAFPWNDGRGRLSHSAPTRGAALRTALVIFAL